MSPPFSFWILSSCLFLALCAFPFLSHAAHGFFSISKCSSSVSLPQVYLLEWRTNRCWLPYCEAHIQKEQLFYIYDRSLSSNTDSPWKWIFHLGPKPILFSSRCSTEFNFKSGSYSLSENLQLFTEIKPVNISILNIWKAFFPKCVHVFPCIFKMNLTLIYYHLLYQRQNAVTSGLWL